MRFIDVFAGCGGLSLGLLKAGHQGVFAVERNATAFETLRHNLIDGERFKFDWPCWLPKKAMSCEDFLSEYGHEALSLNGSIDIMVGGPPCQGFSLAGKRDPNDPRNKMADHYLELVKKIKPKYIVIENVSGFNSKFNFECATQQNTKSATSYAEFICDQLTLLGYKVSRGKVNCAKFGVPQNRHRYLIIGCLRTQDNSIFELLSSEASSFMHSKGLNSQRATTVHEAIADLEIRDKRLVKNNDSSLGSFLEAVYDAPEISSPYLSLIRDGFLGAPNSRRLPNHKPDTVVQFKKIQMASTPGRSLSKAATESLGLKKHSITVLTKNLPAPTITTLPDDVIHYSELRILTARETARLQSFPDWFEFTGKYTTGGKLRKFECPRYTQIGNAVPPLLAEAIGLVISKVDAALQCCFENIKDESQYANAEFQG
ncbi:DNA cytosine methyltransferase [Pseudomonas syringae]|nr:DNA cytosine methyltransferase [Pseudomonas syringae]EPM48912.1 cytosine-specific methyltransferase [Pseudomonas syringae pv. actinidiae ICMP 19098]EPM84822.1 cytosine-specific methyltransferase [Pseudomonas syringae pv. actinidiae ICMP 18804]EPN19609.1 cytosine-specific methyltransferase [Pseudomonas syringae pv. actinidiae ICMP 19100]EPN27464.1 cytosine-specific methyltransferase [Pseudomonas syringae pv. actinidiae ICMP 19099]EPN52980.1 cytosine-specific methyltransferase [Pseudomonas sy